MPSFNYQIILLGDVGVGKSSITFQIVQNIFVEEYDPEIEDIYRKGFTVDNQHCYLEIIDTAEGGGIRNYRGIRTDGFIIVYDITKMSTFESVQTIYDELQINPIKSNKDNIVLVGNKCDLGDSRQVTTKEGKDMSVVLGCSFFETSAKKRINIDECFYHVIRLVRGYFNNLSKKEQKTFLKMRRPRVACSLL